MTEPQKLKSLSPQEKQYAVLPNEADPKSSLPKAMAAALKASGMAKKARKSK
jgi:hypothetical protein